MAKIWRIPFAATGDKTPIPDATQPDGSISNGTGWGPDYELQYPDPSAKDIERAKMNWLFSEVTGGLGEIQRQGMPSWSADATPYPIEAQVYHNGHSWMSVVTNNTAVPGADASWSSFAALAPTQTTRGMPLVATNDDTIYSGDDTKVVTPQKLKFGFAAGQGYLDLPFWLGGIQIRWGGQGASSTPNQLQTFARPFSNACDSVVPCVNTQTGPLPKFISTGASSASGFRFTTYNLTGVFETASFFYIALGR